MLCCGPKRTRKKLQRLESLALADAFAPSFERKRLKRAFTSWHSTITLELNEHEAELLARAVASFTQKHLAMAVRAWNRWCEDSRQALEALRLGLGHLTNRQLSRATHAWMEATEAHREFIAALRRGASHLTHSKAARALTSWREYLDSSSDDLLAWALRHLLHRSLSAGLHNWRELVRQVQTMRRCSCTLAARTLFKGWSTWKERQQAVRAHIAALTEQDGVVQSAIRRMRLRGQALAFGTWQEQSIAEGDRVLRMLECISALSRHAMARGWRSLLAWHTERQEQLATLRRGLAQMRNAAAARGWNAWREMAEDRAAELSQLHRAASHLANRSISIGFASWHAAAHARLHGPMVQAMSFLLNAQLSRSWQALIESSRLHAFRLERTRKSTTSMLNHELRRGWMGWRSMAAEQEAQTGLLQRAWMRFLDGQLSKGWASWAESTFEHVERMTKLRACVSRMINDRLARGFATWHDRVSCMQEDPTARAMRHLLHRGLSIGFRAWEAAAAERSRLYRCLKKGLRMFTNRALVEGFLSWTSRAGRGKRRADKQADRMTGRAAAAFVSRSFVKAWDAWTDLIWERRRVRKGLSRLINRQLSQGWSSWVSLVDERRAMRRGAGFLFQRKASMAMASWIDLVEIEHSHAVQALAKERALRHLLHRHLSRAMSAWCEHTSAVPREDLTARAARHWLNSSLLRYWQRIADAAYHRALLKRGVHHLLERELSCGWSTWAQMATDRVEHLRLLRKGVSMMSNRRLLLGFVQWREEFTSRPDLRGHAVQHMLSRALARGWNSFCEWHAAASASRTTLRKGIGRLANRKAALAFAAWNDSVAKQMFLRQRLRKGLSVILNGRLALGLRAWQRSMRSRHEDKYSYRMLGRAAQYFYNSRLAKTWEVWEALRAFEAQQRRIKQVLLRVFNRKLAIGWSTWAYHVSAKKEMLQSLQQSLSRLGSRQLVQGLVTWQAYAANVPSDSSKRAAAHLMHRSLSRGFTSWRVMWEELVGMRKLMGRVFKRHLVMGFETWKQVAIDRRRVQKSVRRLANLQLARAWLAWKLRLPELAITQSTLRRSIGHMLHQHLSRAFFTWTCMAAERSAHMQLLRKGAARFLQRHFALAFSIWRTYWYLLMLSRIPSPERQPRRPAAPVGKPIPFLLEAPPESPREWGGKVSPAKLPRRPADRYGTPYASPLPKTKKPSNELGLQAEPIPVGVPVGKPLNFGQLGLPITPSLSLKGAHESPRTSATASARRRASILSPGEGRPRRPGTGSSEKQDESSTLVRVQ